MILGSSNSAAYSCVEGSFGGAVLASLCGNYNYGANATNESTTSWGPGLAFSQTVGGDDVSVGTQQNLASYDGMTTSQDDPDLTKVNIMTVSNAIFFT